MRIQEIFADNKIKLLAMHRRSAGIAAIKNKNLAQVSVFNYHVLMDWYLYSAIIGLYQ